jgi:Cu(I)/Ag(I) efflux system membrane protein CusA/SilA
VPILWSTGAGSEVMQRIAVPMIGGMVSSTLLTLVVIPAIYALIKGIGLPASEDDGGSKHGEASAGGSGRRR